MSENFDQDSKNFLNRIYNLIKYETKFMFDNYKNEYNFKTVYEDIKNSVQNIEEFVNKNKNTTNITELVGKLKNVIKTKRMKNNIKENDDVKKQRLLNKLKGTGVQKAGNLSDIEARELIKNNSDKIQKHFDKNDSIDKIAVNLTKKDISIKESGDAISKVNMIEFAKWLDFKPKDVQLGLMIAQISDPDFAYTHLQDTGQFDASDVVYQIYFEYGSLEDAIEAFNNSKK